jgi:serine kinase of HPr protein (carbohydrate metabolism regulator)
MNLTDIIKELNLHVKAGDKQLNREINGGYVSDILSDVLTHAAAGNIWVTRQVHLNIIPIACSRDVAAIIIVNRRQPDKETLDKANRENLPVLGTSMNAFQLVGKLYLMGVRGSDENV